MGVELESSNIKQVDYTHITFPTFYIRERSLRVGLSIQSLELRIPFFTTEKSYLTFLDTTLFWSPVDLGDFSILGPFVQLNVIPNSSYWFYGRTGIKFMWVNAFMDNLVLRNIDFEVGYTINDNEFYASISTDFSMIKEGLTYLDSDAVSEFFLR